MPKRTPQKKRPHPDTLNEKMNLDLYHEKGPYGNERADAKRSTSEGRGPYEEHETRDRNQEFSYRDTENADWNAQEESEPRTPPRQRLAEERDSSGVKKRG